jgi:transcriptional regulator of acetoin/glycerol metabolism
LKASKLRHCRPCSPTPGPATSANIGVADLGLNAPRASAQSLDDLSLEAVEEILIRKALSRTEGNVSHAAEALGLSRGALYRRIEKYGI